MPNFNKILIIIPCGKKKIWAKDSSIRGVKAKDAYISNYFKLCKLYAERFSDKWLILSGKYGIIEPDFVIDNDYDTKLNASKEFQDKVRKQLMPIIRESFTRVISLCGNDYSCFLKDILKPFGFIVETPFEKMKIGERQKQLKKCLERNKPYQAKRSPNGR